MGRSIHELQGTLRAGEAATLKASLEHLLSQGDVLVASAQLEAVDAAIVQVLLSAQRTAAQLDRNLQIDCHDGGALAKLCDRLALRDALCVSEGHMHASVPRDAEPDAPNLNGIE
jgi:ABC-type transporter Mla MlaB component